MSHNHSLIFTFKKPSKQTELLMLYFLELFSLTIVRFILSHLGFSDGIFRTVVLWGVASIPLILFFLYAKDFKQKNYLPFFVLFIVVILIMVLSVLLNPSLIEFYTRSNYGIDRILRPDCAIFAFLFFSLFDDPNELRKNLHIYAFLDFIYLVVVQLLPALSRGYWIDVGAQGQQLRYSYNLTFGYSMAFPTIIFLYYSIKEKKWYDIVLSILGMWFILTQGNRGSLLLPVIFIGLMAISSIVGSKNQSKKVLKILGIIFLTIFIIIFGGILLNNIVTVLTARGVSSRTLQALLSGSFGNDNGREKIWQTVIKAISNGGIFGYGILGDRPFVYPLHYVGYSHNIFLELVCSFGILGILSSLYIIIDAIRMIFFCKDTNWRELYIILFSVSCQLMLSMSLWYVWEFWAAVAIAFKYRNLKSKRKRIKMS